MQFIYREEGLSIMEKRRDISKLAVTMGLVVQLYKCYKCILICTI